MKSQLKISTYQRDNITYLKDSFASFPYKIAETREDKSHSCLELMLMSAAPGIFNQDDHTIDIVVDAKTALSLTTQAYQRYFKMKEGARMLFNVIVKEGATFIHLPHPLVPHQNSDVVAENKIFLQEGARLVWSDILCCGRKLNGEVFQFKKLENHTSIFYRNMLVINEHVRYEPFKKKVDQFGHFENYSHTGTLYVLGETINKASVVSIVESLLSQKIDLCFGVTELGQLGIVLKCLANKAEDIFGSFTEISGELSKLLFNYG